MLARPRPLRRSCGAALALAPATLVLMAGPALAATRDRTPGDPWERMNRGLFGIHQALDAAVFRPLSRLYTRVFPRPIRLGLHHAVVNLGEPEVIINDALQGRGAKAAKTTVRFALNTTIGVFGLFDVAAHGGIPHHANDFGLTLARYGVKSGPYLFIPLLGPTTVRDGLGGLVDLGMNPLSYTRYPGDTEIGITSVVSEGLYKRAAADTDLTALEASATDVYASFRSYYLQNRQSQLTGGKIDLNALPDFDAGVAPVGPGAPGPSPAPTPAAPEGAPTPLASPEPGPQSAPGPSAALAGPGAQIAGSSGAAFGGGATLGPLQDSSW